MHKLSSIITTVRHGHKNDAGELTEIGIEQAKKRGAETQYLKGDTVLLTSGVGRVTDTIGHITNGFSGSFPEHFRLTYNSHYLHYLFDSNKKGGLFSRWDNISEPQEKRMQDFLNQGDISNEPDIYPSPKVMAVRIARILITQIDFATITVPEVMSNFINGTHEPVITSFLYYFLNNYSPKDVSFISKIGGIIDYAEGFNLFVYQALNSQTKITFKFREMEFELDQNDLRSFAQTAID